MHGSWMSPLIPSLYPTDSEQELLIDEDISYTNAEGNSIMRKKDVKLIKKIIINYLNSFYEN